MNVAAVGMFDGVHLGHRHLLDRLREVAGADGHTIAVTFNVHPLSLIAPERTPLLLGTVKERCRLLRQAGADSTEVLDFTPELRRLPAADFLSMLRNRLDIDALVLGFNHSIGSDRFSGSDIEGVGGSLSGVRLYVADEYRMADGTAVSSSAVRWTLTNGNVSLAAEMLARPYSLVGTIGHGAELGRKLGFPTANLIPQPGLMAPAGGVYAADTVVDGKSYRAMVNIGTRPTVDSQDNPTTTIEAHIIGFSGDLYGRKLRLDFLQRLRDEQRFDSLSQLSVQLAIDCKNTLLTKKRT